MRDIEEIFRIGLICIVGFFIGLIVNQPYLDRYKRMEQDYAFYTNTFKTMQGWTSMVGTNTNGINYHLLSLDGGNTWYAVNRHDNGYTLLGPADTVYPGLVKHVKGMDALMEYVSKHGAISNASGAKLLEDAGFTVVPK